MKHVNFFIFIILTGSLISCGNVVHNDHDSSNTEREHEQQPINPQEGLTEIKLNLNNGAKWKSDESTFSGMKRLEMTIANFNNDLENPSISDYNNLGIALANIDNDIISQCSMKGEDHEQLHVLLAPMLANVNVIKNGHDIHEVKVNIDALNKALRQFFEHFEVN